VLRVFWSRTRRVKVFFAGTEEKSTPTASNIETAKLIEDVTVDSKGRLIPRLYSFQTANKELRAMLKAQRDITQLSDAELIAQLADPAKQLGIEINLDYRFA
jgi:hypothetical protein